MVYRIQNMFGRELNMESPDRNPMSSETVNTSERLRAIKNLRGYMFTEVFIMI